MSDKASAKILLVDDEPNILIALEFLLAKEGYTIAKAGNGEEALEVMNTFQPHLVILDVMMPGISGFEVASAIRKESKFDQVQIIFLTAKGTEEDRWQGYSSGGEIYLTKPFENDDLVDSVNYILESFV